MKIPDTVYKKITNLENNQLILNLDHRQLFLDRTK